MIVSELADEATFNAWCAHTHTHTGSAHATSALPLLTQRHIRLGMAEDMPAHSRSEHASTRTLPRAPRSVYSRAAHLSHRATGEGAPTLQARERCAAGLNRLRWSASLAAMTTGLLPLPCARGLAARELVHLLRDCGMYLLQDARRCVKLRRRHGLRWRALRRGTAPPAVPVMCTQYTAT